MATTKVTRNMLNTGIVDNSNATAITIDSSENVGIGTTGPLTKFHVHNGSDAENILIVTGADTTTEYISLGTSSGVGVLKSGHSGAVATSLAFEVAASNGAEIERMRITSIGDVCIGGTNDVHTGSDIGPTLHILSETSGSDVSLHLHPDVGEYSLYAYNGYLAILDHTANTERMRLDSSGNVGIGTTTPARKFSIVSDTTDMASFVGSNSEGLVIVNNTDGRVDILGYSDTLSAYNKVVLRAQGSTDQLSLNTDGSVAVSGALSKGSGSFKIDHPLEAKRNTHHLVHSFVEAPQADNIYRGKVTLINGSATVNIDTVSGMTEGTFVALNRELQVLTSNESDWDAVKGSISGNILTIECQNESSTATISWLVIGERKDQHMFDTNWTDENGKVIVEPEQEQQE